MALMDIFSKRKKRAEQGERPDVYRYDVLPSPLRVQIVHIWADAIGACRHDEHHLWGAIHNAVAREHGVFSLADGRSAFDSCQRFLLGAEDVHEALDIVEVSLQAIDRTAREWNPDWARVHYGVHMTADEAIEEFNARCKEHAVGYQYVNGRLIRVDSQYLHAEAVLPALSLLQDQGFRGPSDEFMKAHEHLRNGRQKEAIVEALKAFESTMKAICDARKWKYRAGAAAKELIQVVFDNELVPAYLQSHFSALRSVLEGGVPTVRNKTSGHGQGAAPVEIPKYLPAYAIHTTAANIVLLVEAHKAKR